MTTAFQVTPGRIYFRDKPERSPRYLAFIRKQASVVSGYGPCEACHTGPHGAGQKSDDRLAIPLTWKEHAAFDADPHEYAKLHRLDIRALTKRLRTDFELNGGKY